MKVRSILLFAAAALMLPIGGALIAHNGFSSGSAYAESSGSALNLLAQNTTPDQEPAGKMHRKDMGGMGAEWGKELNLTAEQQAQIKTIREQEKTASQSLRQQMQTARKQLGTLMAGNASDAQLRQQHDQVRQLDQQLGDRRFDTMLKIRSVLTPEQRTKAAELMKQHHGRRGGREQARGMAPNGGF
jgi:periplasmic protein CpxP/Spy